VQAIGRCIASGKKGRPGVVKNSLSKSTYLYGTLITSASIITIACGLTQVAAQSQNPPPKPPAKQTPLPIQPRPTTQTDSGGALTTQPPETDQDGLDFAEATDTEKTHVLLLHDWKYTRHDMVVTGTIAVYDKDRDIIDTDQPIVMDDKRYHLTADTAHIEHVDKSKELRTVTLTGHVIMVLKPELKESQVPPAAVGPPPQAAAPALAQPPAKAPGGGADTSRKDAEEERNHGGTGYCDKLIYKTYSKLSTMSGHVVFKQSFTQKDAEKKTTKQVERTLTCDYAENDGKANLLHLFKPVHFESNQDQKLDTPEDVVMGTKEGEETMTIKKGSLKFTPETDDDDQPTGAKPGAKETKDQKKPAKSQ